MDYCNNTQLNIVVTTNLKDYLKFAMLLIRNFPRISVGKLEANDRNNPQFPLMK